MPEPLSSKLSRTLVAFTIEVDDEFEQRLPHRTTNHGRSPGLGADEAAPWLVSLLMWSMCMRLVPAGGTTVRAYARSAWWLTPKGVSTTLRRMSGWWGYLRVEAAGSGAATRGDKVVRPTAAGRRAQEVWATVVDEVEARWSDRLGRERVGALRSALVDLAGRLERPLPDCLPLYDVDLDRRAPRSVQVPGSLPGLLSQVILAFELEFDAEHPVPMRLCGNVLRVLGDGPVPVKDLAVRTGLARDGVESELRALQRRELVDVGPDPSGGRLRVARLTRAAVARQQLAVEVTDAVEQRWRQRFGDQCLGALSDVMVEVAGAPDDPHGPLWEGLYRYGDGWRSSLPRPRTLPHHPVVSHRGGYLDGA